MKKLEFNIDNQESMFKVLESLAFDLHLRLKFRHRYLPLPLVAMQIPNCNKKCTVSITLDMMIITVAGILSKKQLNYINSSLVETNEDTLSRMKEDWKNNVNNEFWIELIDLNNVIGSTLKAGGLIELIEGEKEEYQINFSIPWMKTTHNKA